MKEWGVGDPNKTPGGLAESGPKPEAPVRQVILMQRKNKNLDAIWVKLQVGFIVAL